MATEILREPQGQDADEGARAYDAITKRMGEISASSYMSDGIEDMPRMLEILRIGLQDALARSPDYQFGFLLPLVELVDGNRLGVYPNDGWTAIEGLNRWRTMPATEIDCPIPPHLG